MAWRQSRPPAPEAVEGFASGDVILTVLVRRRQKPEMAAAITTPLRCA